MSTKSKALAKTAAAEAVAVKTGYIANILADADKAALQTVKRGSNVETRKAEITKALVANQKKAVADHLKALKNLAGQAAELASLDSDEMAAHGLSDEDAVLAMRQYLDIKMAKELADASYDVVKELVFQTMNVAFAEAGEEFPEHVNGYIDVPDLGKRFCREGAGRKDASLDDVKLAEIIGDELFAAITTEKVVVTRVVDEDKLAAAVAANPALMEQVRAAVKTGDWKSPRLMVRAIPANETEQE